MFENIKSGDKVVLQRRWHSSHRYYIVTVERVTKTLVIVGNTKFKKKSGNQTPRPSNWNCGDSIHLVSEETMKLVEKTKIERMAKSISNTDWIELAKKNPELINNIYDLLQLESLGLGVGYD